MPSQLVPGGFTASAQMDFLRRPKIQIHRGLPRRGAPSEFIALGLEKPRPTRSHCTKSDPDLRASKLGITFPMWIYIYTEREREREREWRI